MLAGDAYAYTHPYTHTYCDADSNSHPYTHTYCDADSNPHPNTHTYAYNTKPDANRDAYCYT